ncbi:MAG: recombinase family protein [Myxococcaceae bacterium]|nr:recombinase family protein [Myxococcaceae bacterium]
MNAVAYTRVSSRGQDLGMQTAAIEKAAAARGDTISRWFSEKKSAKSLGREELTRLRAEVRSGRLAGQRCYVFRLDRLTRSGIRDMFEVVEEIRANGCELVTVADGFDLSGPAAEVVLAVMAWAAKMELVARGERVAAARDRLEAEGRAWGRPSRLTEDQRERIYELKKAGKTIRKIAAVVKVPRSTVARALSRKSVTGKQVSGPKGGTP